MNQKYFTPSVDTAARALGLLSRYNTRSATLSEIAAALDASKATCLRVLKTLEAHGLLRFNPETKRYSLGYYCVVLGARAEEGLDYLTYLRPLMQEAAERTGLIAAFVQRVSPDRLMYVAKEDGHQNTDINVSVGNRFPLTDVSYGKWFVAYADEDERRRLLANGLRQVTPKTVVDPTQYLADVDTALAEGVLVSRSEYIRGVTAISCPALGTKGELIGVLAVLGLSDELHDATLEKSRRTMQDIGSRCHFDGASQDRHIVGNAPQFVHETAD